MNANVLVSVMSDSSRFEDEESLKDFLAAQLYLGRLSLVLGAGASFGFGLPSWDVLIDNAFKKANISKPSTKTNNESLSEHLLTKVCVNNEILFAELIRDALYQNYDLSFETIRKNDLLAAIGAIVMSSLRGNVSRIISYNFDEVLEIYLKYFGFIINSVASVPAWSLKSDVTIYHPHGFLPSKDEITSRIILAQIQFDRITGRDKEIWRQIQLDILRSNTCLFIGLSGDDANLRTVLTDVDEIHVCKQSNIKYRGIRFSDDIDDPNKMPS